MTTIIFPENLYRWADFRAVLDTTVVGQELAGLSPSDVFNNENCLERMTAACLELSSGETPWSLVGRDFSEYRRGVSDLQIPKGPLSAGLYLYAVVESIIAWMRKL